MKKLRQCSITMFNNTSTKVVFEDIVVAKDVEEWINYIKEIVED